MKTRPVLLICCLSLVLMFSCNSNSSEPDNAFDVSVERPMLAKQHPRVLFDECHNEHHRIDDTYEPFAKLISNDGCMVKTNNKQINKITLAGADIFVIITAMGITDPGDVSPFTSNEIDELEQWVKNGGSALVVTEHYPFGLAMSALLEKFAVTVHNGYTEDTLLNNKNISDALLFKKSSGNLNVSHPIFNDVEQINTFTGSAVKGDPTWVPLLNFSPAAQNYNVKVLVERKGGDVITNVEYAGFYPAKGYSQGLCKKYGKGRVVVLAESACLTAQTDKNGNKFGINVPGTDNKQFALNIIRWLAAN